MNNDLISRSALKEELTSGTRDKFVFVCLSRVLEKIDNAPIVEYPEQITVECDTEEDKQKLLSALRNVKLKAIVEDERPQGHWIKDCDSCDCSNCYDSGARFTRKDCSGRCSNCGELQCCTDNFCPNCGADMRGGRE